MLAALKHFTARARAMFRKPEADQDFAEELESHVEMLTADNIARGMSPDEARRAARIRLGAASSLAVQHRDARSLPALEDLFQDLRFAVRLLVKERWFSAAAIAAIALGIGANTVGFTIINAAFFRGFDFPEADRLQAISWRPINGRRAAASYLDLEDWRAQTKSFSGIAAWSWGAINISDDHAAPEQAQGSSVTGNFFDVLQKQPLLGRGLSTGDEQRGADRVVVISYDLWTRRYARDPNVLGRTLRVNSDPATVVGIMPERVKFGENAGSELWVPFVPTDAQLSRASRPLSVFGRLADGVSRESAQAELDTLAAQLRAAHPDDTKTFTGIMAETFHQRFLNGAAPRMFVVVMVAVVFVLLIACANVANLLLSRSMYRAREIAVRYSMGATRWRIVRQLLAESVLLSSIGGAIGLVLAAQAVQAFDAAVEPTQRPYWLNFTIDYQVLGYVAAICVATGVLFGLAPALQVSANNQADSLKEGARSMAGNRRAGRFGNGLVIAELALTLVLLCGAGLTLRSFGALYASDPGFKVEGLTATRMQLPPAKYPTADARLRFFDQLTPLLSAVPGITGIAVTTSRPPLHDAAWRFAIDGQPPQDDERRPFVATVTITPEYFTVLGVPISRGRDLSHFDGAPGAEHVVISQVMAERYFADEEPIGRRIRFVPRSDDNTKTRQPWHTIVGVSGRMLQGSPDEAFKSPVVYLPLRQAAPRTANVMIRSALPPATVLASVREAVQSIDPDQPVLNITTAAQVLAEGRSIYGVFATLFGLLASIGLVLSAVGIYGVMAYAVTQRIQEIGVRMAVGAQRWQVSWMFLKRGLVQLTIAFIIGLPAAFALGIVASFRLVDVEPGDPLTMVGITAIVAIVALVSCVLPAHRASRVDPVIALRTD